MTTALEGMNLAEEVKESAIDDSDPLEDYKLSLTTPTKSDSTVSHKKSTGASGGKKKKKTVKKKSTT